MVFLFAFVIKGNCKSDSVCFWSYRLSRNTSDIRQWGCHQFLWWSNRLWFFKRCLLHRSQTFEFNGWLTWQNTNTFNTKTNSFITLNIRQTSFYFILKSNPSSHLDIKHTHTHKNKIMEKTKKVNTITIAMRKKKPTLFGIYY